MAFTPWKTLSSKVLIKYRKWDYVEDEVELPNGRQMNYQYIRALDFVTIIARDQDGDLIVIDEYRYLLNDLSLELPAGMIEDGMTPLETAHKELIEETGLKVGNMEFLGKTFIAVGIVQGWGHVFLASELIRVDRKLEDTEQIEIRKMSPQEFDKAVKGGKVVSSHVMAAWMMARDKILAN